jgi:Phage tail sheath C-terminal domain/Phage tail sheath protein subtilisin-like domain
MAGGRWIAQNKVRAGAFINFTAAPKKSTSIGIRGIVALPVVLPWGADNTLIQINSNELTTGKAYVKTGIRVTDDTEAAQMIREALKNTYTALIYKLNTGGTKAAATLAADVTATAKHTGTVGNAITVIVDAAGEGLFSIKTVVNGEEKDNQTVADAAGFVTNDWVMIAGAGALAPTAGVALTGGANGTAGAYAGFYDALATTSIKWNCAAIPATTEAAAATAFIDTLRDAEGLYVQAVTNNGGAPDHEGIINTMGQGYVYSDGERVEPNVFTCWLAGATAGAAIDESNTYRVVEDAVDIINPLRPTEIEEAITGGYLVLSSRQDGKIVIEQDINSLTSFTTDKPADWRKNRVVRTLDDIATQIRTTFETNYVGKVDNNDSGRTILKADIVSLFNQAQGIGAIRDFDSSKDIVIEAGVEIDAVIANIAVHPVDSMEKLYATISLN